MLSAILQWFSWNWEVKKWRKFAFRHFDIRFRCAERTFTRNERLAFSSPSISCSHFTTRFWPAIPGYKNILTTLVRLVVHPMIHRVLYYTFSVVRAPMYSKATSMDFTWLVLDLWLNQNPETYRIAGIVLWSAAYKEIAQSVQACLPRYKHLSKLHSVWPLCKL